MNNKTKTALITGATSGIGAAYARQLANEGYNLILTGRRANVIHALADSLRDAHQVDVDVQIVELSSDNDLNQFLERITGREIDLLINNAGFGTTKFFHRETLEIQEKMVSAHIIAMLRLTHAILPDMIANGRGAIINVSSLGAFLATPDTATYSGTKAFYRAFTESLHLELMNSGVKVQVVCPGLTKTDMHSRLGIPEEYIQTKGAMIWGSPEEVVASSLKALRKNQVICIPGWNNRLSVFMRSVFPDTWYYRSAYQMFKRQGWIREDSL